MNTLMLVVVIILLIIVLFKINSVSKKYTSSYDIEEKIETLKNEISKNNSELRKEVLVTVQNSIKTMGDIIIQNQKPYLESQNKSILDNGDTMVKHLESMNKSINTQIVNMCINIEERLKTSAVDNQNKLTEIRETVENKLTSLQNDNSQKLDEMRNVVDEKLQKTLESRISKSFEIVSTQLEQVYKGLGEMQNLATGVGDLKKVLSNVKTRGILGEIQLGAILSEILAPDQYETNFVTKRGSGYPVEYAIKLPTDDGNGVYLPIDSKFPGDTYTKLLDAYDNGNKCEIDLAAKELIKTIKNEAKDINEKYIDSPNTTDFAIMFLPFEGLYAEVVNRGLVEELQTKYKINIAGPSTMAALLNSLQMGFRTFAIQKRSGEVWNVLGAVKTEFYKFGGVLEKTQKKLEEANKELDTLVGVRTRQIKKKLSSVEKLDDNMSEYILNYDENEVE